MAQIAKAGSAAFPPGKSVPWAFMKGWGSSAYICSIKDPFVLLSLPLNDEVLFLHHLRTMHGFSTIVCLIYLHRIQFIPGFPGGAGGKGFATIHSSAMVSILQPDPFGRFERGPLGLLVSSIHVPGPGVPPKDPSRRRSPTIGWGEFKKPANPKWVARSVSGNMETQTCAASPSCLILSNT